MTTLVFHVEPGEEGIAWWVESPQHPRVYAAGPDLVTTRHRALAMLRELGDTSVIEEVLGDSDQSETPMELADTSPRQALGARIAGRRLVSV